MTRIELSTGYRIVSNGGKDLVALDSEGDELARAKVVDVPSGETSLDWIEVDEKPHEPEQPLNEDDIKKRRIYELKKELAALESGQ